MAFTIWIKYFGNHWGPGTVWLPIFFKVYYFVFSRNNMRVNKLRQNVHFWWTIPLRAYLFGCYTHHEKVLNEFYGIIYFSRHGISFNVCNTSGCIMEVFYNTQSLADHSVCLHFKGAPVVYLLKVSSFDVVWNEHFDNVWYCCNSVWIFYM